MTKSNNTINNNGRKFRISSVLGKSFGTYFAHFFSFTFSTLVVFIPMIIGITILNMTGMFRQSYFYIQGIDPMVASQIFFGTILSILILTIVLFPINAAIIFNTTYQRHRNGRSKIVSSFKIGFARGFWVILSSITGTVVIVIVTMALIHGSKLAVDAIERSSDFRFPELYDSIFVQVLYIVYISIPALILLSMWITALPASVIEDLGPIQSLLRAQRLSKGKRVRIFIALLLALIFAVGVMTAYISMLFWIQPRGNASIITTLVILSALSITLTAFLFIVPSVIYHDLRSTKEIIDIQKFSVVFD